MLLNCKGMIWREDLLMLSSTGVICKKSLFCSIEIVTNDAFLQIYISKNAKAFSQRSPIAPQSLFSISEVFTRFSWRIHWVLYFLMRALLRLMKCSLASLWRFSTFRMEKRSKNCVSVWLPARRMKPGQWLVHSSPWACPRPRLAWVGGSSGSGWPRPPAGRRRWRRTSRRGRGNRSDTIAYAQQLEHTWVTMS